MTEQAKVTGNGEAIIPKEIWEQLAWPPGTELSIEASGGRLVVQPKPEPHERISYEEFRRRVPRHDGPALTIEDMDEAIDRAMAERWKAKEARSR